MDLTCPYPGDQQLGWLITPLGFFSIVCKPADEEQGTLTVRSCVKSDLEALRKNFLPSL
jgi:hypothetical protein